jgi:hypothetical protein
MTKAQLSALMLAALDAECRAERLGDAASLLKAQEARDAYHAALCAALPCKALAA